MNLEPTSDSRVFQTQWFVDANHPLIETKIFYSKADNLLYYITTHRGPTIDDLQPTSVVKGMTLGDADGRSDNETDAFNALVKFLDKPIS